MPVVTYLSKENKIVEIPTELLNGKRHLKDTEIAVLEKNRNSSENWENVYVSDCEDGFDAELVRDSRFEGYVIIGNLRYAKLKYHDLELECGIVNSLVRNCVLGDDNVIRNIAYLENYRLGQRVMLFNVQEISCTNHSKFGNGILKEGEKESARIWIGVGNENDGRAILPFDSMIPADAYIWSRNRDDGELQKRFVELTEYGFSKKLDTFGVIENDAIVKNATLIKDAKIGAFAYIKGAFKLKNVTIFSSEDEPSQIGEGVELVNGIMGYGCHVFYQAVGIRFVLGRNCQLKYGARLINSVLGDNSTVSCCELLNNLIFPFHEQHHNSSFLIATTILGQSNIAAGATIGSNHNSRSPDGEIIAGRGFWPGLCSDFKHNSRFSSFVLVSKGSYQHELDIQFPFSLVAPGETPNSPIHILPAWWFMYDMFAIVRNKYKFAKRDKRVVKVQDIEFDPLAPDTMQEVCFAVKKIIDLTAASLSQLDAMAAENAKTPEELHQAAKDYLHNSNNEKFTLFDVLSQKKYGGMIYKPLRAYKSYRQVLKYFAVKTLMDFCKANKLSALEEIIISEVKLQPLYEKWQNVGGQVIPEEKLSLLYEKIKNHSIENWQQVHDFYGKCKSEYLNQKARYAIFVLEKLYSCNIEDFDEEIYTDIMEDVSKMAQKMYDASVESREKDFTDYYRCMPYSGKEEMTAVLGTLHDNDFLQSLEKDTKEFNNALSHIFRGLTK